MAVEREYRVTISGVLGRSTSAAFGEMVADAARAKKKIDDILAAPNKGAEGAAKREAKARVDEAQKAARELERIREKENNAILRDVEKITRAEERAHERAQKHVANVKERYFREEQSRQEKADNERAARNQRIASDALGYMRKAASVATRVAGEVVGGLGVSFDLGRGVSKAVDLEKMAVAIVNAGNRGTGSAIDRNADVLALQDTARTVGDKYKLDPTKVLSGLGQYQALTGDLDTAKAGLDGLAGLAKAFNVDLDVMVATAGQVGSAIGEVGEGKEFATAADKAKAVNDVLRALTAQGQEGAIEIGNLATQMAKLKAAGGRFEGSTAESIKKMGALAQLAMQLGGAASPTQAATAVMGFANTLATPARRKEFEAMGIKVDSATQKGAFADPFEIIRRSLTTTGGDMEKMKKLFANVVGERAVTALTTSYNRAGGGDKGLAAVNEQFARFGGTITDDQINENLGRALNTKESKAQEFQNRIDRITSYMADRLIPALEKLEDPAAKAAQAITGIVVSAAEHPWAAVATVIGGSIAAAVGKQVLGEVLGKAIAGSLGNALAGKGLAVGAITASIAMAYMAIQAYSEDKDKAGADAKARADADAELLKRAETEAASKGGLSRETANALARRRAEIAGEQKRAGRYDASEDVGWFGQMGAGIISTVTGDKSLAEYEGGAGQNQKDKASLDAVASKLDTMIAEFVKANPPKKGGPQEVVIVGGSITAPTGGTVAQ